MPSDQAEDMVSTSARNRLSLPMRDDPAADRSCRCRSASCVPMTMPTMAQAMPTGSACLGAVGQRVDAGAQRRAAAAANEGVPATSAPTTPATERRRWRRANSARRRAQGRSRRRTRNAERPEPRRDGDAEDQRDGQRQAHRCRRRAACSRRRAGRRARPAAASGTSASRIAFQAFGQLRSRHAARPGLPASRCTSQKQAAK